MRTAGMDRRDGFREVCGVEGDIDFDARYVVDGNEGVAFYLIGWDVSFPYDENLAAWDLDAEDYVMEVEPEPVESDTMVRSCMVGDDQVWVVDVSDLHIISDDEYCSGCGQTGCHAYG